MAKSRKRAHKRFDGAELHSPISLLAFAYLLLTTGLAVADLRGTVHCPLWLVVYCWAVLPLSLLTFILYARDKRLAVIHAGRTFREGATRIPEATLHLWEFLGGWPGALLAQKTLRHKSNKSPFLAITWLTVTLHLVLIFFAIRFVFR